MKQVRALIVDDSLLFREILQQELERDVNVRVAGKAVDAFDASNQILSVQPDAIIVDVVMERMSGLEFAERLLPQYYLPVILVSADPSNRKAAESIPTVTFFQKPTEFQSSELFYSSILAKLRTIANAESFSEGRAVKAASKLIVIGASTGGAEAIERLLSDLPSTMPPIVICQHMPPRFTRMFAERLNQSCRLSVKEAVHGDLIIPGQAYIAPGGFHLSVRKRQNRLCLQCTENDLDNPVCPSVDILFDSVAQCVQGNAMGVLLTGMGKDGAAGLLHLRQAGNSTIGQDEGSSVVYGMPKAAYELGAVENQWPLGRMPAKLVEWAWR